MVVSADFGKAFAIATWVQLIHYGFFDIIAATIILEEKYEIKQLHGRRQEKGTALS